MSVRRIPGGLALAALALFAVGRAEAGRIVSSSTCNEVEAFPRATLNVVILPYQADRAASGSLEGPALDLGLLLQLDSLLTLGRYGNLGVVYLHTDQPDSPSCSVDAVERQLFGYSDLSGRGQETILTGHALILVWGRIYQEDGNLYLQTYMRFQRQGAIDGIEQRLPEGGTFQARTPVSEVAFPPHRLAPVDLGEILHEFHRASKLYREPAETAPSEPWLIDSKKTITTFTVKEVRDGWLRISDGSKVLGSIMPFKMVSREGWLKARIDPREWSLHQKLPELDFLDALAGYLQYRVAAVGPGPALATIPYWIEASLESYLKKSKTSPFRDQLIQRLAGKSEEIKEHFLEVFPERSGTGSVPEALAEILLGNLRWLAGRPEEAELFYHRAVERIPYSADALNLDILAKNAQDLTENGVLEPDSWFTTSAKEDTRLERLERAWRNCLELEPSNRDIVENLWTLYTSELQKGIWYESAPISKLPLTPWMSGGFAYTWNMDTLPDRGDDLFSKLAEVEKVRMNLQKSQRRPKLLP